MPGAETVLSKTIRLAVARSGLATLWRNNVGFASAEKVRYGLAVGSADLIGFRHSDQKFVGIEVKTPTGRISEEQQRWLDFMARRGCIVGVARSVDDALAIVRGEVSQ